MSDDDTAMLAMWDAKMSTASIAMTLGRKSEARVANRLAQLLEDRRRIAAGVVRAAEIVTLLPEPEPPSVRRQRPSPPREIAATPSAARERDERRVAQFWDLARSMHGVRRVPPMSDRRRGFIARFLAAGWPVNEVAWLFDLEPEDVGELA